MTKVFCAECGKEEFVPESRAKKYLCCSRECLGKYNSKRYSQKVELVCPICGEKYYCKHSSISRHKTCGKQDCRKKWLQQTRTGKNNSNYKTVADKLKDLGTHTRKNNNLHYHIVKEHFNLPNLKAIPKGYDIHHKDGNHNNNDKTNLVLLPRNVHMLIHRWFGNILINALHSGKISKEVFFNLCNKEQKEFYEQIIDLDITNQVVVKQGELLETPEEGNQQPSVYRNVYKGSTTNERVLTDKAEDSNFDTSALPINSINGDDIV